MFNFVEAGQLLLAAGAALQVRDGAQLLQSLRDLLTDAEQRHAVGEQARQVVDQNRGALDETMQLLAAPIVQRCRCRQGVGTKKVRESATG